MTGSRVLTRQARRDDIVGWLIAAVLVALLSSCAGTPEDNEALIGAVAGNTSDYEPVFGAIDGDCFAREVVPGLGGTMKIEEQYGFTVASANEGQNILDRTFPREEARVVASALSNCGYLRTFMTEVAEDVGLTEGDVDCLVAETGDAGLFISSFAPIFMDPDADTFSLQDAFSTTLYSTVNDCGADIDFLDWFTVEVTPRDS